MQKEEYTNVFNSLISRKESEVVEFKRAEKNFDFDDLGKYFSALSNEANLRGLEFAWLIFGYDEKKRSIVGTSYKNGEGALNNLKHDFAQHATDGQTFREIIPIEEDGKRILMFKIPASPRNIVMKWKGIAYGRDGESLKPLNQSKQDEIRRQSPERDWSAEIVSNASLDDLDELKKAMIKLVLQLGVNAGERGFKRGDVYDMLEQSLPASLTKTQKLSFVSHMLRDMQSDGFLTKTENGKAWLLTKKGSFELNS